MTTSSQSDLSAFFSRYKSKTYPRSSTILRSEEEPQGVYYLDSGYVRFYSISPEGKELTLNIFKPGSFFPMTWAMGDRPNNYFFETLSDAVITLAPKKEFLNHLRQDPETLFDLSRRIMVGMDGLLTRMEYLLFGSAAQRVASVLLLMARRFGVSNGNGEVKINLWLTHQQIANLAGLSREPTSLEMKKLEREGLLASSSGELLIKNIDRLKEVSLLYRDESPLPYTF